MTERAAETSERARSPAFQAIEGLRAGDFGAEG
jgi:hypothetical protein